MPTIFCPSCHRQADIEDRLLTTALRCGACGHRFLGRAGLPAAIVKVIAAPTKPPRLPQFDPLRPAAVLGSFLVLAALLVRLAIDAPVAIDRPSKSAAITVEPIYYALGSGSETQLLIIIPSAGPRIGDGGDLWKGLTNACATGECLYQFDSAGAASSGLDPGVDWLTGLRLEVWRRQLIASQQYTSVPQPCEGAEAAARSLLALRLTERGSSSWQSNRTRLGRGTDMTPGWTPAEAILLTRLCGGPAALARLATGDGDRLSVWLEGHANAWSHRDPEAIASSWHQLAADGTASSPGDATALLKMVKCLLKPPHKFILVGDLAAFGPGGCVAALQAEGVLHRLDEAGLAGLVSGWIAETRQRQAIERRQGELRHALESSDNAVCLAAAKALIAEPMSPSTLYCLRQKLRQGSATPALLKASPEQWTAVADPGQPPVLRLATVQELAREGAAGADRLFDLDPKPEVLTREHIYPQPSAMAIASAMREADPEFSFRGRLVERLVDSPGGFGDALVANVIALGGFPVSPTADTAKRLDQALGWLLQRPRGERETTWLAVVPLAGAVATAGFWTDNLAQFDTLVRGPTWKDYVQNRGRGWQEWIPLTIALEVAEPRIVALCGEALLPGAPLVQPQQPADYNRFRYSLAGQALAIRACIDPGARAARALLKRSGFQPEVALFRLDVEPDAAMLAYARAQGSEILERMFNEKLAWYVPQTLQDPFPIHFGPGSTAAVARLMPQLSQNTHLRNIISICAWELGVMAREDPTALGLLQTMAGYSDVARDELRRLRGPKP